MFVKGMERTLPLKAAIDVHVHEPCGSNHKVFGGDYEVDVELFRDDGLTIPYVFSSGYKKFVFLDCEQIYARASLRIKPEKCEKYLLKIKKIQLCSSTYGPLVPYDEAYPDSTGCATPLPDVTVVTIWDAITGHTGGKTWNTTFLDPEITPGLNCSNSQVGVCWTAHTIGAPKTTILAQFTWSVHIVHDKRSINPPSYYQLTTSKILSAGANNRYVAQTPSLSITARNYGNNYQQDSISIHRENETKHGGKFQVICDPEIQIWDSESRSCVVRPLYDVEHISDDYHKFIVIAFLVCIPIVAVLYCCCWGGTGGYCGKGRYSSHSDSSDKQIYTLSKKTKHHHHHHHTHPAGQLPRQRNIIIQ